uniref:Uncharacterized protein n=1 Tax=Anopheles epiroticus TaxID=199890 RepID=A0A182PAR5_9DIPT
MTPLAQAPVAGAPVETTTVNPNAKQYIPPPGQYYPATGQYVPPGEYDPATGIFTPGRYIPDTSIFQSGQYDPLTQMFTPGRYEANGQFVPDPNHPPLSLAPPNDGSTAGQTAAVTPAAAAVQSAQSEPVATPAVASLKTTSGGSMKTVSLLTALGALIVSESFRQIVRF